MSWRIVMIEHGEYMRLRLDNLHVKRGSDEFTIPLSDISLILVENLETVLSTRLLDACAQYNICLVVCDYKHHPSGIFNGINTHSRSAKVQYKQVMWSQEFKDYTWKEIIKAKITNQYLVLKYHPNISDNENSEKLIEYLNQIELGDSTNREGHAAKVYFNGLFGKEFSRRNDELINVALNYAYSIIRAYFSRLIVANGLNGIFGLFHKNEYNSYALADDLMEPFRPIVDYHILGLIQKYDEFTLDFRIELVDLLNSKLAYEDKNMYLCNVMDTYVNKFIKYADGSNISTFSMPLVPYNEQV